MAFFRVFLLVIATLLLVSSTSANENLNRYEWIDHAKHVYLIYDETGHGTGFAVKDDKGRVWVVTNRHVCGFLNTPMTMRDHEGNEYPVKKRLLAKNSDLCAIEAPSNAVPLEMADGVQLGEHFTTAGYPLIQFMSENEGRVLGFNPQNASWIAHEVPSELSETQCSEVGILIKVEDHTGKYAYCKIQVTNTAVSNLIIGQGSSGSPIVNDDNEVIGVLFGGRPMGGPLVLASFIKVETLRSFLSAI